MGRKMFIVILALIIGMAVCLEITNLMRPGGALQSYHREYAGGGSKKWRGAWGNTFQAYVLWPALLVYPLSVLGILAAALSLKRQNEEKKDKAEKVCMIVLLALILARFIYLGVFSAALQMG